MVIALFPAPTVPVISLPSLIKLKVAGAAALSAFFPRDWNSANHLPSRPDEAQWRQDEHSGDANDYSTHA